jgi:hypothetical protein
MVGAARPTNQTQISRMSLIPSTPMTPISQIDRPAAAAKAALNVHADFPNL